MPELLLELYSEEIPPKLQISARKELKLLLVKALEEECLKYKLISTYSSPTRLTVLITEIPEKVKISSKEIKGPKVGVLDDILNSFVRANSASKKDIFKKEIEKGNFYFIKTKPKEVLSKDLLIKIILNSLASLSWRKSMRWSDKNLLWGRPLMSILAIFNRKVLSFNYGHLKSKDTTVVEQDLSIKYKKVKSYSEYQIFLKNNKIILDHDEREKKILKKFETICRSKNFKEFFDKRL